MKINRCEAIVWDFDDTLYPENKEWKAKALPYLTAAFAERFYKGRSDEWIRQQYEEQFVAAQGSHNTAWSKLLKIPANYDLSTVHSFNELEALVEKEYKDNPTDPGFVEQILNRIDRKKYLKPDKRIVGMFSSYTEEFPYIKQYIFSNSTEESVLNLMKHLLINPEIFSGMQFCDGIHIQKKPHASGFEKLPELTGKRKENIIYVGDSEKKDIIPARKAGIKTIRVWCEGGATVSDFHVYHPEETLDLIRKINENE